MMPVFRQLFFTWIFPWIFSKKSRFGGIHIALLFLIRETFL